MLIHKTVLNLFKFCTKPKDRLPSCEGVHVKRGGGWIEATATKGTVMGRVVVKPPEDILPVKPPEGSIEKLESILLPDVKTGAGSFWGRGDTLGSYFRVRESETLQHVQSVGPDLAVYQANVPIPEIPFLGVSKVTEGAVSSALGRLRLDALREGVQVLHKIACDLKLGDLEVGADIILDRVLRLAVVGDTARVEIFLPLVDKY